MSFQFENLMKTTKILAFSPFPLNAWGVWKCHIRNEHQLSVLGICHLHCVKQFGMGNSIYCCISRKFAVCSQKFAVLISEEQLIMKEREREREEYKANNPCQRRWNNLIYLLLLLFLAKKMPCLWLIIPWCDSLDMSGWTHAENKLINSNDIMTEQNWHSKPLFSRRILAIVILSDHWEPILVKKKRNRIWTFAQPPQFTLCNGEFLVEHFCLAELLICNTPK